MRPFGAPETTLRELDAAAMASMLSAANDLTLVTDAGGVVIDIAADLEGLPSERYAHWIGQPWADAVSAESRPKVRDLLAVGAPGSDPTRARARQINALLADGTELPLSASSVPIGAGRVLVCARDLRATAVLQQRLVEAQQSMERDYWKFRHAETRYRHLFQVAGEAVLVVDATTQKILEANPAAAPAPIDQTLPPPPRRGKRLTDWLGNVPQPAADTPRAEELPDWLKTLSAENAAKEAQARQKAAEAASAEPLPDWLTPAGPPTGRRHTGRRTPGRQHDEHEYGPPASHSAATHRRTQRRVVG